MIFFLWSSLSHTPTVKKGEIKKTSTEDTFTLILIRVRGGLDYGEEMHWLVKNLQPRQGFFEATFDMADPMAKNIKNMNN